MLGKLPAFSTPHMAASGGSGGERDPPGGIKDMLEQTFVPYMEQVLEYLGLE